MNYIKINRISPENSKYLQTVVHLAKKPKALYYRGQIPTARQVSVAIVGTRRPTSYGKEVTYKFAYELAKKGVIIISGLALGIDAIAHRGALDAKGITLAILANSVDKVQPRTNENLGKEIIENGGAIISEYEPPTDAREYRLLERNRLVSGLSDAIIIVEAAARSGTLSTAASALEQGKHVFVVPGNITSPLSAGCNALIKQGAFPITCIEDVLEVIAPDLLQPQTMLALGNTPLESTIITLLQSGVRDGDELHRQSKSIATDFSQALTMMEIGGTIKALGGNQWTLR